jgi:hypothetical protein
LWEASSKLIVVHDPAVDYEALCEFAREFHTKEFNESNFNT